MPWTKEGVDHLATQDKFGRVYNIDLPYAGREHAVIDVLKENGAVEVLPVVKEAKKEAPDGS